MLLPWLPREEVPTAAGQRVLLRGPRPADYQAWADLRERALPALAELRNTLGGAVTQTPCNVELAIGSARLVGIVHDVYTRLNGEFALVGLRMQRTAHFGDLLPFYVRYAALRLSGNNVAPVFLEELKSGVIAEPPLLAAIRAQDDSQMRNGLETLLVMARQSQRVPFLFPVKTAWAWCTAKPDARFDKARGEWEEGEFKKGEGGYSPGYNALFARGANFLDGTSAASRAFAQTCTQVAAALDPQRTVLLRDTEPARQ